MIGWDNCFVFIGPLHGSLNNEHTSTVITVLEV